MNLLILTSIILSVILGVGRMVDLALFTDAETGLCVVGSVWLRYAALAVAILLAVAAGRAAKPEARILSKRSKISMPGWKWSGSARRSTAVRSWG